MGRGIALYDNALMYNPAYLEEEYDEYSSEEDASFELSELQGTIATAIGGEMVEEWHKDYYLRHLKVIAENSKLQVCVEFEDTYWQLVVLPKTYSIWLKDCKSLAEDETTGYGYSNSRGEWIEEVLRPYSVDRDARRLFRKLIVLLGNEKFAVRTSQWTSCQLNKNSFKAIKKAA